MHEGKEKCVLNFGSETPLKETSFLSETSEVMVILKRIYVNML
jgi:hypothetical protein